MNEHLVTMCRDIDDLKSHIYPEQDEVRRRLQSLYHDVKYAIAILYGDDEDWILLENKMPRAGRWVWVQCKSGYACLACRQKDSNVFWKSQGVQLIEPYRWRMRE